MEGQLEAGVDQLVHELEIGLVLQGFGHEEVATSFGAVEWPSRLRGAEPVVAQHVVYGLDILQRRVVGVVEHGEGEAFTDGKRRHPATLSAIVEPGEVLGTSGRFRASS